MGSVSGEPSPSLENLGRAGANDDRFHPYSKPRDSKRANSQKAQSTAKVRTGEEAEEFMANVAGEATANACEQTPSDLPLVNLLLTFQAQVEVLNRYGIFDDPTTVIGEALNGKYAELSGNIAKDIARARQSEPVEDMDTYLASETQLPRPYHFELANGAKDDIDGLENLALEASHKVLLDERVVKALERGDEAGVVECIKEVAAATDVTALVEKEQRIFNVTSAASNEALENAVGPERYKAMEDQMENTINEHNQRRSELKGEFRMTKAEIDRQKEMNTDAGAGDQLPVVLGYQGARTPFAGTGPLEAFLDSAIAPWRGTRFDVPRFLLSMLNYNLLAKDPVSAFLTIVPTVIGFMSGPYSLQIWVASIAVRTLFACRATPSRCPLAALCLGTFATTVYDGRSDQARVLDYCADKHRYLAGRDLMAGVDNCVNSLVSQYKTTPGWDLRLATEAKKAAVSALKRQQEKKGWRGRELGKLLYDWQFKATHDPDSLDGAFLAVLHNDFVRQHGTRILSALGAVSTVVHAFHYRYRPDRARMYLYQNHPNREAVKQAVEDQGTLLKMLPKVFRPTIGVDACESLATHLRDYGSEQSAWARHFTGWEDITNAQIIERAKELSTACVEPFVERRSSLEETWSAYGYDVKKLTVVLRDFDREWEGFSKTKGLYLSRGISPRGTEFTQAPRSRLTGSVDETVEVGHDWYALRKLIITLWSYATGYYGRLSVDGLNELFKDMVWSFKLANEISSVRMYAIVQPFPGELVPPHELADLEDRFNKYLTPRITPSRSATSYWNSAKDRSVLGRVQRVEPSANRAGLGQALWRWLRGSGQPVDAVAPEARRARLMRARAAIAAGGAGGAGSVVAEAFAELRLRK